MRLDELLEARPGVGLELWMLDQEGPQWHAAVHDPAHPATTRQDGQGSSPIQALCNALELADVDVTDEAPF